MMLTADLPDARFASDTPTVDAFTLTAGGFTMRTLPVEIGELSETMSLASRRRLHQSDDGAELTFETVNTIPFGAEPQIQRKLKISDGLIQVTADLVMRASCQLTKLSAGGLVISGGIRKFRLATPPKMGCLPSLGEKQDFSEIPAENGVIFDQPFPPLALSLESETERFDWMTGDDFWRWTQAGRIGGGRSRFVITREGDSIRMQWQLFDKIPSRTGEDEPVPGRNWRLTWAVAWKKTAAPRRKKIPQELSFDPVAFDWPGSARAAASLKKQAKKDRGCFCAGATLNALKKWVRSHLDRIEPGSVLEIANIQPVYCVNASHVDRAKYQSLPHWDMMSIIEFRRWANRALAGKNASLRICAPEKSSWRGFMVLD